MNRRSIPFQFDMEQVLGGLRRLASDHLGDVTLTLPFLSIAVKAKDRERQVAREIVIRLKDRRVLNAWECCDGCIDQALASLQEIRRALVEKQVKLAEAQDGALYLLIEAMISAIRQFLTFEQRLGGRERGTGEHRSPDMRDAYFDGLELLRGHLSRCLSQIAALGGMNAPTDGLIPHYAGPWPEEAYRPLGQASGVRASSV